jgi:C-terminal processing protease CtpA/Prc
MLFSPTVYQPCPLKITTLPLFVLVDARTYSGAEELAAMMQDNHAALIVSSVSAGAGCGSFIAEGVEVRLSHRCGVVHLPDCVRRRADGSSERRGVVPDVLVPWGPSDSQFERMEKTVRALAALH